MTAPAYTGLTWDHPRGFNALDAAARALDPARDGLTLSWDKHSLEGFEERPIAEICGLYDLVVIDHPHVGEAVAAGCLIPVEDLFTAEELAGWSDAAIGRSFSSYRYGGRHWALPLDAATQVMASRRDRVETPPATWDEVLALSERAPVILSVSGPHAALSFQSICVALGEAPASDRETFIGEDAGARAYDLMAALTARAPEAFRTANPIAILEHMSRHDDVALCPLVYGYVNYAPLGPVRFSDAPRGPGGIGSTLGGTGIGVSNRAEVTPALLDHLRWLMSEAAQHGFIPDHDGQPSLRSAWRDPAVNAKWGGFYEGTFDTLEAAYVRPRHDRAIAFQTEASALLRDGLFTRRPAQPVIADLNAAYRRHHAPGAET